MFDAVKSQPVDVMLSRDFVVKQTIFRPVPHPLYLAVKVHPPEGQKRKNDSDERILLLVKVGDNEVVFDALPDPAVVGQGDSYRNLFPFGKYGNPGRVPERENVALIPTVPSGRSTIEFKLIEVGGQLSDARATLIIKSPIDFKLEPPPGYNWLWWFAFFWPVFVLLLGVYGAVLLWQSFRTPASPNPSVNPDAPR